MTKKTFFTSLVLIKILFSKLNGGERRRAAAEIALQLGHGGKAIVCEYLNISRPTLNKGIGEVITGIFIEDKFHEKGRKPIEEILPYLLDDIKDIVDSQSQADPKFESARLYTRITVAEIRKQLILQKGYTDEQLPSNQTLNTKVNELGYTLTKVQKTKPLKKPDNIDQHFDQLHKINKEADEDEKTLRISIDAKATVNVGNLSRNGKTRTKETADDHDFVKDTVTPFGIYIPQLDKIFYYMVETKVTADCIVDCLEKCWNENPGIFNGIERLVINLDNGPENSSRRTQFIKRIVEMSAKTGLLIELAYYPPYHSKYNPIERTWAILELHWNGSILDTIETAVLFTESMTWNGDHPKVSLISNIYKLGVKLSKKVMNAYENVINRAEKLGKYFIKIFPEKARTIL